MAVFVLLTRVSPMALRSGHTLEELERDVVDRVTQECPDVRWLTSLAVLGPYDYLDVFQAPDVETAARVATLVRVYGKAETETWAAIEWPRFKELLGRLPGHIAEA
ncbi:MAG TPA: GYD domain-containing protein [Gemmatimonadales bacterium]|nr:GYD domain-containing protein [Gemmatimonadales bacterium]